MLHALIIGINTYDRNTKINGRYCFDKLQGCVADAQALHDWLAADQGPNLKARLLLDQEATKDNIVKAFRDDLSKAQAGDSILIFYSGHGTVEMADAAVWREETDGRLEGLACYYETGDSGKFILADKELRYLLKEISKPDVHIAALFDCCHSGDNTRSATETDFTRKQGLVVFDQRPWSDFIFSDKLKREEFLWNNLNDLLPEGAYVQLAASESNEPAIEAWINQERHGVFAYFLLDMLRENGGRITYLDLCNRIRNRIRYKYGQRIKIYTPREHTALQDTGFLLKTPPDVGTGYGATVDYNEELNEYRINRGILDRVVSQKTRVKVVDNGVAYEGVIGSTELNLAQVIFDGTTLSKLSRKAMPDAVLEGLASRPLRVCVHNQDLPDAEAAALSAALFTKEYEAFILEESDEARADYTLHIWAGMYYFTRPGDWYRPEVMPLFQEDENALQNLLGHLQQMAQWHFMLDLHNETETKIPTDFLKLELTDGQNAPLALTNGVLEMTPKPGSDGRGNTVYTTAVKVKFTNTGTQDLYVQPVFMYDFGCMINQITNPASDRPIESGKSEIFQVMIAPQTPAIDYIPMGIDESVRLFNRPYGHGFLKFIISLSPITGTSKLDLTPLPMPDGLLESTRGGDTTKGPFMVTAQTQTLPKDGWNAFHLEVRVKNPLFDNPDRDELKRYMDPETGKASLAHFFTGLYFEQQAGPSVRLALRTDLDGLEKGIFSDALLSGANFWANYRRNQRYKQMVKKYPDLPRMVSEGDSWFQHPLLTDIIDNIGSNYPTYCLAAAGDTIRNYFSKGEVLEAVRKVQPAVLILSGGGNDILGEEMPGFLNEFSGDLEEGQNPERFFAPTFAAELEDIGEIYRNLFTHFKNERPDMPILVHSYDYPHPRPTGAGHRSNWLGQYFDGKKITRAGDRSAAVKYMLDAFNDRLKQVVEAFPGQVHFIDVRNIVHDNQWDDEIHPNNSGFQSVSAQFLRKIKELLG